MGCSLAGQLHRELDVTHLLAQVLAFGVSPPEGGSSGVTTQTCDIPPQEGTLCQTPWGKMRDMVMWGPSALPGLKSFCCGGFGTGLPRPSTHIAGGVVGGTMPSGSTTQKGSSAEPRSQTLEVLSGDRDRAEWGQCRLVHHFWSGKGASGAHPGVFPAWGPAAEDAPEVPV